MIIPHVYLHTRDGGASIEDPDGSDLPDLDTAWAGSPASAGEILAAKLRAGKERNGRRIEITDEVGKVLAIVPFKAAIRLATA